MWLLWLLVRLGFLGLLDRLRRQMRAAAQITLKLFGTTERRDLALNMLSYLPRSACSLWATTIGLAAMLVSF